MQNVAPAMHLVAAQPLPVAQANNRPSILNQIKNSSNNNAKQGTVLVGCFTLMSTLIIMSLSRQPQALEGTNEIFKWIGISVLGGAIGAGIGKFLDMREYANSQPILPN
ncbi:MAG: hypothetical protein V4629_08980 [Pseudomonadota bacterium]